MKALNINVERTGFPVTLSGLNFFFDCSAEHIEEYKVKYAEVEKKLNESKDDDDIESKKEALGLGYDVMLGDGAFSKLYKEVPDLIAWINAFFDLASGIAQNIDEFKQEQESKSNNVQKEYLKKKAIKKG